MTHAEKALKAMYDARNDLYRIINGTGRAK